MATLGANVIVVHPESGEALILVSGDTVPKWADGLIGEHALVADDAAGASSDAGYSSLTKAELVAVIEERNTGRDEDKTLSASGNKADLVAALVADDAAAESV